MERQVLKGSRWLLLKNPENLDPKYRKQERLAAALELNQPLALAYYMKEDLRQIWMQPDKTTATKILYDWVHRAFASGISTSSNLPNRGLNGPGILADDDYPISTAPLRAPTIKSKL